MKLNRLFSSLALAFALAASIGAFAQTQPSKVKHYKLTGTVKSVDTAKHSLVVDGADIPGFMPAMTMPYDVAKAESLDKISAGDKIQADVSVADNDTHLENVKVTAHAAKGK